MSGIRDLLIRGSEKVIGHYRLLWGGRRPRRTANFTEVGSSVSSGCRTSSATVSGQARRVSCRPDDDRFAAFDIVLKRRGHSRWK